MFEETIKEIVAPFLDKYELISGGSCDDYLRDGLYINLKAKFPITITNPMITWKSAEIVIENPYVHVLRGFGNDIRYALSMIK